MHLVQILLPLSDKDGRRFEDQMFSNVHQELTGRFGGVTVFARAPAKGTFSSGGSVENDDIVIFEVMCDDVDRKWWSAYRSGLECAFRQDEVIVRASLIDKL